VRAGLALEIEMEKRYEIKAMDAWIIDPVLGRVMDATRTPIDGKGPLASAPVDGIRYESKLGRDVITHPACDDIVHWTRNYWQRLPLKGGPQIVQCLQEQNADLVNPTMQRFEFRLVRVSERITEIHGVPEYDEAGKLVAEDAPAAVAA
jgi:hypothetical protein